MRIAALYIHGRVVLGASHLDAFEQLTPEEKDSDDISSGFFNQETMEFDGYVEHEHFFNKKIMLMRHGKPRNDDLDPGLSNEGINEVIQVARQILQFNLTGFTGYTSPMRRCLETARIVHEYTGLTFSVAPELMETPPFLNEGETFFLKKHCDQFPNYNWPDCSGWHIEAEPTSAFRQRVGTVLRGLPTRSILVSHRGLVENMARMALCDEKVRFHGVRTASLTFIEDQHVRCLGRTLDEDHCQH